MTHKVLCPNHRYDKILMTYDPGLRRFWIHCGDRKCNRWIQVDINKLGGVNTTLMPEGHQFDFETMPTLVKET